MAHVQESDLIKASSTWKCILNLLIWQPDLLAGWGRQKECTIYVTMGGLQAMVKIHETMM